MTFESILFMTAPVFAQLYSSKDALYVVGGVTTQKGKTQNLNWSSGEADASVAVSVSKNVTNMQYHPQLLEYPSTEKSVFSVVTAPTHVHLKHCQSLEKR